MKDSLPLSMLRRLLAKPMRLAAWYVAAVLLLTVPDLLLRCYVDADLPRAALATLIVVLAAAGLFLRASWRRRSDFRVTFKRRSCALFIAVLRGADGASTRTAVVFDRYRRPPPSSGPTVVTPGG
ncbi:MAG TPA: hypothetical protein VMW75_07225 [Thermoanaerobaculia bacterium]|nr:hypothetical protein [Thermoanaerobaculia bacterium]